MFSKNLKYLREKNNMDQIDLAESLGRKSSSSVSEWEKGKYTPKAKILAEIANALAYLEEEKEIDTNKLEINELQDYVDIAEEHGFELEE